MIVHVAIGTCRYMYIMKWLYTLYTVNKITNTNKPMYKEWRMVSTRIEDRFASFKERIWLLQLKTLTHLKNIIIPVLRRFFRPIMLLFQNYLPPIALSIHWSNGLNPMSNILDPFLALQKLPEFSLYVI